MEAAMRMSFILLAFASLISIISADTKTYIIHTDYSKLGLQNSKPEECYETMLNSVKKTENADEEELAPELLYTYETTMTGFAAKLTTRQFKSLTKIDGVLYGTPDEMLTLHTTYSTNFLELEYGMGLWNESNLANDVIIGFLDTGIWPEHSSFSDTGLSKVPIRWKGSCEKGTNFTPSNCNKKVIGARPFLKGYETINGRVNETTEFRSARDSNGHGTHTASTAAGSRISGANLFGNGLGTASGMRFTSRIAAYKVCWDEGCASSDILAAIDQAVSDGVDIISMSLGGFPRPYFQDSLAIAAFGATQKGVFMSCSAGNSGPTTSTVSNLAPWMMTVAASYIDRSFPTQVQLSIGKTFIGASLYIGVNKTKEYPIVYKAAAGGARAEYCLNGTLSPALVKDKIVLCDRGINGRAEKGFMVKSAGGAGMILLNTPAQGQELIADAHILPATTLDASDAKTLRSYYFFNKNLSASITFLGTKYGSRAPIVAAFSSRGPSLVDPNVIKPDITAPGVNILAAWPPVTPPTEVKDDTRRVDFNIISGTSMSCPHISGIAALIKSAHQNWSPAAIKSAIMTSAYFHDDRGDLISDRSISNSTMFGTATPFAFGSGHVNPDKAADPGLVYDISSEDYLNYLCGTGYTNAQVTVLARKNYTCPHTAKSGDLNYPSFAVIFEPGRRGKTTFTYKRTVTNVGSSKTKFSLFLEMPKNVKVTVKPAVLNFKAVGEKLTYKVTFTDQSEGEISSRGVSSFGYLIWVGGRYSVRSPIAVTWQ
ncbi:subtilisin-like protease SBT1.1 [Silene latifolia]|uniref:subtilisin-like protease SBT1.1 n=1 Tax=Silene latifolia TaxID=37657 RepID=UPI003D783697